MAIVRFPNFGYVPSRLQEMERMRTEMDNFFGGLMREASRTADSGVFPALNVVEESDKITVYAELPGFNPDDIEIAVEGNTLSLQGERKSEDMGGMTYHRRERTAGKFRKALTLPLAINPDGIEARFEHGVLKVVLPKAQHAMPKKIRVLATDSTSTVEIGS
jgi:HSP20 family protein